MLRGGIGSISRASARVVTIGLAVIAIAAAAAFAHRPLTVGPTYGSPDDALFLKEIETSQVVYASLTAEASERWLAFDVDGPTTLRLSLGIPKIDRLVDYRPSIAVLGPGLPDIEPPIEASGFSSRVTFRGESPAEDLSFFEPFTGTASWITAEETVALPEAGRYVVVAWAEPATADKLWVAIGSRERFGLRDVFNMPTIRRDVRAFHELPASKTRIPWERVLVVGVMALVLVTALVR